MKTHIKHVVMALALTGLVSSTMAFAVTPGTPYDPRRSESIVRAALEDPMPLVTLVEFRRGIDKGRLWQTGQRANLNLSQLSSQDLAKVNITPYEALRIGHITVGTGDSLTFSPSIRSILALGTAGLTIKDTVGGTRITDRILGGTGADQIFLGGITVQGSNGTVLDKGFYANVRTPMLNIQNARSTSDAVTGLANNNYVRTLRMDGASSQGISEEGWDAIGKTVAIFGGAEDAIKRYAAATAGKQRVVISDISGPRAAGLVESYRTLSVVSYHNSKDKPVVTYGREVNEAMRAAFRSPINLNAPAVSFTEIQGHVAFNFGQILQIWVTAEAAGVADGREVLGNYGKQIGWALGDFQTDKTVGLAFPIGNKRMNDITTSFMIGLASTLRPGAQVSLVPVVSTSTDSAYTGKVLGDIGKTFSNANVRVTYNLDKNSPDVKRQLTEQLPRGDITDNIPTERIMLRDKPYIANDIPEAATPHIQLPTSAEPASELMTNTSRRQPLGDE